MTTKPYSNDEVIEEYERKRTTWQSEGGFCTDDGVDDDLVIDWLHTLLAQKDKEVADARRVSTIEAWNDAIELSDKLEESNTKFDEWRAFKGFRNGLRDRIRELQTPPDQTDNYKVHHAQIISNGEGGTNPTN